MKIDGKQITNTILEELKANVKKLQEKNITPNLAIILVGDNPASLAYVRQKDLKAKNIGIKTTILHLSNKTSQKDLIKAIEQFNDNNNVRGIIVQQPLPKNINTKTVVLAIDPKKDVDGFHPKSKFEMPIALAVLKILEIITRSLLALGLQNLSLSSWLKNKNIIIIGKGETGGKPIINALRKLGVQPLIIDSKTQNPQSITKKADIIISAVGKSNIVKKDMIKNGVILISVGLHKGIDGKLHGDYNEDEIKNIASFYTPTPGGVGPVNVAMLLKNLIETAKK